MKADILRFLAQEKSRDVFFTTMIDLYAIHAGFPNLAETERLRATPCRRVQALEDAFGEDVGDVRFIPHIQLHEYEAYLFADPHCFAHDYDGSEREIAELEAIAGRHDTPELIDDGAATAPNKRIIARFPDYESAKATLGPELAKLIGLRRIRETCPHFEAWLSRLECLDSTP